MTIRNPKLEGSNIIDCIPQKGPCPMNCNQCFYNRPNAFYAGIEPLIPTLEEVGDGIVRMNCGHDSNIERDLVIKTAKKYKHFFFNTSIPKFDFPGPVVFTANPKEEEWVPFHKADNLMFVRLRVSTSNLKHIEEAAMMYSRLHNIPVVLTFMAYYDQEPPGCEKYGNGSDFTFWFTKEDKTKIIPYVWKIRHINSYWCPTKEFMKYVLNRMKKIGGRLVTMCGTLDSNYCKDCHNCETYYWQTIKHMKEVNK